LLSKRANAGSRRRSRTGDRSTSSRRLGSGRNETCIADRRIPKHQTVAADRRLRQHVDRDGVETTEQLGIRASIWLLIAAMLVVAVAVLVIVRPAIEQALSAPAAPSANTAPRASTSAPHDNAMEPHPPPPDGRAAHRELPDRRPPASRDVAAAPPVPGADGDPDAAASAGAPSGIALFPPPGTKPILKGIIVPEGTILPPGYVRHYQTTDDGRQLPPILMFHPDYQPVDDRGEPIALPEDRVVPPDMAPPGLEIQTLDDPDSTASPSGVSRSRPAP
jgi:hypothetical protein